MGQEENPREAFVFLPQNDNNCRSESYNMVRRDAEDGTPLASSKEFDPFQERQVANPTTDCQTLTHLLKSTLGSGIMSMPYAFKSAGLVGGGLGVMFMMLVCTHTSYILVDCAHQLYYRTRKTKMDYEDVAEAAFASGPKWSRKYSKLARNILQVLLFSAYFGASSTDNILIAENYGQVYTYYTTYWPLIGSNDTQFNATAAAAASMTPEDSLLRIIMGCLLPFLILFVWVPDLKYLTPLSSIANVLMGTGLAITIYFLVQSPLPISKLSFTRPISEFPVFFSVTLFAMENIGVMMPLENSMATPRNFLGTCGILNRAMFGISFVYLLLGLLGYMKYGDKVDAVITTSLPVLDIKAQVVKILIGTTVLFTYSLQFYVCREMVWNRVKRYFPHKPLLAEYIIRALLVTACVSVSVAIPRIGPLVNLIGALGFSIIGILYPVMIEIIVYWDIGFGRFHWKIYKNIMLGMIGILAIIFGSMSAIKGIIDVFV